MFVHQSFCLSILHGKNIKQEAQSRQPNFFVPAMLLGIIDCYQFILISVMLIVVESHTVSRKQNLLFLFFSHHF